jgi:Protein of unknown function (DUF4199)
MKRTVLIFGVISGLVSAVTMLATFPFMHKISSDKALIIGYTTIVLAGLLVFFGIRSYRDNVSGGKLTFARGLAVGILISLLSNCLYVATWEIVSYKFMPDFAEKYASQMVEHAKSTGASQQKIDETARQAQDFVRNYHNPLYSISMTFLEPFPVFLVITLLSAAILRKKTAAVTVS